MATIREEFTVSAAPDAVWAVFKDFGAVHTRLAKGFVTDTKLEEGARVVTFANGMSAKELLVTMDDAARRLVYAVSGSPQLTHHNASFQVFAEGAGSRVVWVADVLPNAAEGPLSGMMTAGVEAMRASLG